MSYRYKERRSQVRRYAAILERYRETVTSGSVRAGGCDAPGYLATHRVSSGAGCYIIVYLRGGTQIILSVRQRIATVIHSRSKRPMLA
jgi:hypothetical protein